MSLRFHEIAEGNHRLLNPFNMDKLMLLGEICDLSSDTRMLDLCCGKAEMLCQWSKRWGISGTGVDISSVFINAAKARADETGVADKLTLIEGDAAKYEEEAAAYDIVSCIGATWIGDGLIGTLKLMLPALKPGGLLLVGEPYWMTTPPEHAYEQMDDDPDTFTSLIGTLDRIESVGLELVEMVMSNQDDWDRYVASQWRTIDKWLRANPDDPEANELYKWNAKWKRQYLDFERQHFNWGVFVMRVK